MKFIFEVKIKPGCTDEQYIEAWQKGSAIIQKEPGALGTKLHRKIGEEHAFLAIASWESKTSREEAMTKLKNVDSETRQFLDLHEQFAEIKIIGSFEDAEWEVSPE